MHRHDWPALKLRDHLQDVHLIKTKDLCFATLVEVHRAQHTTEELTSPSSVT